MNEGNFDQVRRYVADSLHFIEGNQTVKLSRDTYYDYFQWDSVFNPRYKVLNIKSVDDLVEIRLETTSDRLKFLENNPLVTEQQIHLIDQKISKIDFTSYGDVDWNHWSAKRDSLISWMKVHHPEHPEFIYDLTKTGAENYIKAIALFHNTHEK
ncbi:hypothetical protein BST97_02685 [Nonlabens spongiae]|uniref:Uncharacterized protein n=1 Tax=Nonlabens spongiae TaxID=331648 RepID=A0A1W6MHB3_9FLAO|nr:hypothetical protein BST97_02685 [Nonlabens spongiae]